MQWVKRLFGGTPERDCERKQKKVRASLDGVADSELAGWQSLWNCKRDTRTVECIGRVGGARLVKRRAKTLALRVPCANFSDKCESLLCRGFGGYSVFDIPCRTDFQGQVVLAAALLCL